jgi:hypothetical protein
LPVERGTNLKERAFSRRLHMIADSKRKHTDIIVYTLCAATGSTHSRTYFRVCLCSARHYVSKFTDLEPSLCLCPSVSTPSIVPRPSKTPVTLHNPLYHNDDDHQHLGFLTQNEKSIQPTVDDRCDATCDRSLTTEHHLNVLKSQPRPKQPPNHSVIIIIPLRMFDFVFMSRFMSFLLVVAVPRADTRTLGDVGGIKGSARFFTPLSVRRLWRSTTVIARAHDWIRTRTDAVHNHS